MTERIFKIYGAVAIVGLFFLSSSVSTDLAAQQQQNEYELLWMNTYGGNDHIFSKKILTGFIRRKTL